MVNRNLVLIFCLCFLFSCKKFNYQTVIVNYANNTLKVSSDNYVIDSIVMSRQMEKVFVLSLINKNGGTSTLNFKNPNSQYDVSIDKLADFCDKSKEDNWDSVKIFIRRKGYNEEYDSNSDFNDIQVFRYKYLPCNSERIETIEAERYYK